MHNCGDNLKSKNKNLIIEKINNIKNVNLNMFLFFTKELGEGISDI